MYPMLRNRLDASGSDQSKDAMLHLIQNDEDVLFAWSSVSIYLSDSESHLLLKDVIRLWTNIRGFSIASKLVEDFKVATKQTTKGKKALRKQLIQQYEEREEDN